MLEAWLSPDEYLGFLKGNVIKYTARAAKKGRVQDHAKAAWYAERITTFMDGRTDYGQTF